MSDRSIHAIHSECDVYVSKTAGEIRLRFREKNPELVNPTDFEIEGDAEHIAEALATAASILYNVDELDKEPS